MSKSKTTTALVPWTAQRIAKRDEIIAALVAEDISPARVARGLSQMFDARKRIMVYGDEGRTTEFIIDATAVRAAIELTLQLWGVIKAEGFEVPQEHQHSEDLEVGQAIGDVYAQRLALGMPLEDIHAWLSGPQGALGVRARLRERAVEAGVGQ